jgi:hypothetical protein
VSASLETPFTGLAMRKSAPRRPKIRAHNRSSRLTRHLHRPRLQAIGEAGSFAAAVRLQPNKGLAYRGSLLILSVMEIRNGQRVKEMALSSGAEPIGDVEREDFLFQTAVTH